MIEVPKGAKQHKTAGPYSPVLEISGIDKLVVISGQVAVDMDGVVVGNTIEDQTIKMLENAKNQLNTAGCDFSDVFKVNVYMKDLAHWPRFNAVYREIMSPPYPARTAVQVGLLDEFLVEIEMWAVKTK